MVPSAWVMPSPDTDRPFLRSLQSDFLKSVDASASTVNPFTANLTPGQRPETLEIVPSKLTFFDTNGVGGSGGGGSGAGVGWGAGVGEGGAGGAGAGGFGA